MKIFFIILGACIALAGGIWYWSYSQRYVSTDNAYVNTDIVQMSSQVNGQVIKLHVANNQLVAKGDLLFEIDPEPFRLAIDKAKAQLAIAEANLENVRSGSKRVMMLYEKKTLSIQDRDDAIKNLQVAIATVHLDRAVLERAELDLSNTQVTAPINGYVSNMSLLVGNMVTAMRPLFSLIGNEQYWIDANFKENELQNVKPGQKTKIIVDMYPSYVFQGVVESISGGSGAAFSLLPPQNATGNWIKITQRVPVKIKILNADVAHQLRVGTTAVVTIDTHSI